MPQRLEDSTGEVIASSVEWARSARARLRGLVGRELEPDFALILSPAYQVHTFFMKEPIDVALCDRDWSVLWVRRSMPPRRIGAWRTLGRFGVETKSGGLPASVVEGSRLRLVDVE